MDYFATKGIEYLLMIGYLLLFVPFALLLRRMASEPARAVQPAMMPPAEPWLGVPQGVHWHRGHTWASVEDDRLLRVGIDEFAQRMIGAPTSLSLPSKGAKLEQGEKGWQLQVDGQAIDLLSPVQGEVVEVNDEVLHRPALVCEEPYERGWLLKVRVDSAATALKNLLPAQLARAWMDEVRQQLGVLTGGELGPVLQDGGLPVPGFAPLLFGDRWPEVASWFLLTERESPLQGSDSDRG
jgi:glycine cleavage system H protein